MRARVYRDFTFRAYSEDEPNVSFVRSDNFFTVESQLTAMLKDRMANNELPHSYIIKQESKDGKYSRPLERVFTRNNDDTVYISMIPDLANIAIEASEPTEPKKGKKTNKK